jgi:Mlc titration factor MtfA (ptsG expression regulator)
MLASVLLRWLTERRRARLLEAPFPDAWRAILARNVKAYGLLDADEQHRLCQLVQVFVAEKRWEGCGGLELDDEVRVTIAGSACLLILGRDHDLMREVVSIVVYPSAVLLPEPPVATFDGRPRIVGAPHEVLGVAHRGGPVVLAWDSVLAGAGDPADGHNVVIHEMAHKIDFLDGVADGTPPLDTAAERRAWARICTEVFNAVRHHETMLSDYAGTNEAEFFAVASEAFFEQPAQLARELPELYGILRAFYNLDLAAR